MTGAGAAEAREEGIMSATAVKIVGASVRGVGRLGHSDGFGLEARVAAVGRAGLGRWRQRATHRQGQRLHGLAARQQSISGC